MWRGSPQFGYEALSESEAQQWSALIIAEFREWENSHYQFERGLFTPEDFEPRRERWRRTMSSSFEAPEGYRSVWSFSRDYFSPSFRAEIDRIVAEVAQ